MTPYDLAQQLCSNFYSSVLGKPSREKFVKIITIAIECDRVQLVQEMCWELRQLMDQKTRTDKCPPPAKIKTGKKKNK